MVGRVLVVEGVGTFGVTVEGGDHACEGRQDLVGSRSGEGDVFGWDHALRESCVGREVVGRQSACDL